MFGLIYTNDDGDLLAKKFAKQNEYAEFVATIKPEHLLYINDKVHKENVPEKQKEEFPIFLKSLKKQWGGTTYVHIKHQIESVVQGEGQVEITVKPKKQRKKRTPKPKA